MMQSLLNQGMGGKVRATAVRKEKQRWVSIFMLLRVIQFGPASMLHGLIRITNPAMDG